MNWLHHNCDLIDSPRWIKQYPVSFVSIFLFGRLCLSSWRIVNQKDTFKWHETDCIFGLPACIRLFSGDGGARERELLRSSRLYGYGRSAIFFGQWVRPLVGLPLRRLFPDVGTLVYHRIRLSIGADEGGTDDVAILSPEFPQGFAAFLCIHNSI